MVETSFEKWNYRNVLRDLWEKLMIKLSTTHAKMAVWMLRNKLEVGKEIQVQFFAATVCSGEQFDLQLLKHKQMYKASRNP